MKGREGEEALADGAGDDVAVWSRGVAAGSGGACGRDGFRMGYRKVLGLEVRNGSRTSVVGEGGGSCRGAEAQLVEAA